MKPSIKVEETINPNIRKHIGAPSLTGRENWGKYSLGILVELGYGFAYVAFVLVVSYLVLTYMQALG